MDAKKNVLIVGSVSNFVEILAQKFQREGLQTYVLTCDTVKQVKNVERVYHMAYDNNSVREVIAACRPDVIVYMGAYDTRFQWTEQNKLSDYRACISGCDHLLAIAEDLSVGRFILLSSQCVFEHHRLVPIDENAKTVCKSIKSKALAMCEASLEFYDTHFSMETLVLRFDDLYFCPSGPNECEGPLMQMCLEAITEGTIHLNTKQLHGALYAPDAAEALFHVVAANSLPRSLYHVTGEEVVSEDQIGNCIVKAASTAVEVIDQTAGTERCNALNGDAFAKDFSFHPHFQMEEGVSAVIEFMQKNIGRFNSASKARRRENSAFTRVFHSVYPYLESIAAFLVVLLLKILLANNPNFAFLDLFLLYVVVFALMHGLSHAILASTLSFLGYFFILQRQTDFLSSIMDVSMYLWVAQTFIVGMSVGILRDQIAQVRGDKDDEIGYLKERLSDISVINASTTEIKDYFEQQIISNKESKGYFYDIVKRLDEASEKEIIFVAVQILESAMSTKNVSIYLMSEYYARLLATSNDAAAQLGKSIKVEKYGQIFDELNKKEIFVDRALDPNLPSMAVGIWDGENKLSYIIMLWDLPFEQMTLDGCNMLRILSLLLANAIGRANKYLSAVEEHQYFAHTKVLKPDALREVLDIFEKNYSALEQEYAVLLIADTNGEPEILNSKVLRFIRVNDYVGMLESGVGLVLLSNTDRKEAHMVIQRFMGNGVITRTIDRTELKQLLEDASKCHLNLTESSEGAAPSHLVLPEAYQAQPVLAQAKGGQDLSKTAPAGDNLAAPVIETTARIQKIPEVTLPDRDLELPKAQPVYDKPVLPEIKTTDAVPEPPKVTMPDRNLELPKAQPVYDKPVLPEIKTAAVVPEIPKVTLPERDLELPKAQPVYTKPVPEIKTTAAVPEIPKVTLPERTLELPKAEPVHTKPVPPEIKTTDVVSEIPKVTLSDRDLELIKAVLAYERLTMPVSAPSYAWPNQFPAPTAMPVPEARVEKGKKDKDKKGKDKKDKGKKDKDKKDKDKKDKDKKKKK